MTRCVVDASTIVATIIPDEHSDETERVRVFFNDAEMIQPCHWPIELTGSVLKASRRKRIASEYHRAARDAALFYIDGATVESVAHAAAAFDLATRHHISGYDAAYLELALRGSLPLLTKDGALRRAATAVGLQVLDIA